jgi:hypothetical protein
MFRTLPTRAAAVSGKTIVIDVYPGFATTPDLPHQNQTLTCESTVHRLRVTGDLYTSSSSLIFL